MKSQLGRIETLFRMNYTKRKNAVLFLRNCVRIYSRKKKTARKYWMKFW